MIKFLTTGKGKENGRGRGLRLFRCGGKQLEMWWFPAGEVVEDHIHKFATVRLFFLLGKMTFWSEPTGEKSKTLMVPGSTLKIPAGVAHGARVDYPFSVFLTYEKWSEPPSSIAQDIEFTGRNIATILGGMSAQ
jgi:quercetin dioxygenase-like cupin family protein